MRRHKPIELALRRVPLPYGLERASCPNDCGGDAPVVGRLGLRLVFRCDRCAVSFHRTTRAQNPV